MSLPKIPDMNPNVTVDRSDAVNLILFSIGMEEIGLSHIINAEGEKIQYVLGTLTDGDGNAIAPPAGVTIDKVLEVNKSVSGSLKDVLRNQLMLQLKLEDAMEIISTSTV
ncbi:hypothetical protein [uncultured Clostridium sp.]|uniref:hypothetical protein n=1 Tax=uncultured Clostridium sp. TaxID=59620 RepID=UPI0026162EA5|nr:hypothetical protein [uncultured Clostridium sp.]